jgi:predicted O-linked N-acetylglucosamine transferase (SPINDLY family)
LYEIILAADRRHFGALCRLGLAKLQQLKFDDAARLFRRALKQDKKSADACQYLAFALTGLERSEEAIPFYNEALKIRPDFPEARNNLGHVLQKLGRLDEAIVNFKKALALRPDYAEASNNLGNAFHLLGRSDEAIAHYEQAIAFNPQYAEAYWNLGNGLRALDRTEEAVAHFERAIAIRHDYSEAHNSLGNTFRELDRPERAISSYETAIAIKPDYADAHVNLADTLTQLQRQDDAIKHFRAAVELRPSDVLTLNRFGAALASLKLPKEAITVFEEVLSIDPRNAMAVDAIMRLAANMCDWERTAAMAPQLAACVASNQVVEPFGFLAYCTDPALHLACATNYIGNEIPVRPKPLWQGGIWKNERIRIAYLATGFQRHPAAYLTVELFELHDRSRFEVLGFSMGADDQSEIRRRVVAAFDEFHDIRSKNDQEVAELLNQMQVDIVVDRTGYTQNSRPGIFARRPSPIQVNYLGFPGTLGADFYDYVIADPIALPFDQQPFFMEKIVHLPDCYQSNDSKRAIAKETPTRQQLGLPSEGFVFCCFNNNYKITPDIFSIWMRVMHKIDESVLWLLGGDGGVENNVRKEAAASGVDPARVIFAERRDLSDHLARHRQADLFLDTLPYNAHTTASDALWAGLPVVTCRGPTFAARVAASLLSAVGLPELVTETLENYEALILKLATEPARLREVREKLARNRLVAPLFNTDRYRRHIEAAYQQMWERWQAGESPRSFAVAPIDDLSAQGRR